MVKRLLIFTGYFFPHTGGYENAILDLSRRLVEKNYQIDILTCNTERGLEYEELDNICVYRLPCWNALNSTYPIPKPNTTSARILRKLLKKRYDIVSSQCRFFVTSLLGLIFAKVRRVPLVHGELGSKHSVVSSSLLNLVSRFYDHTIGSLIVKSARINTAISQATADFLQHLGARNIHVIYSGIDTEVYKKRQTNFRGRLGIGRDVILITFTGRLIFSKGVQDLILAFSNINEIEPCTKLFIVGDGPYRSTLEFLASQQQGGANILFLGNKGQAEIIEILSNSDIFCNPSYSEGLSISILEAASIGLPIIATNIGGPKEIIQNETNGFLIPCQDVKALTDITLKLIRSKDLRISLGENARRHIERNFNWTNVVGKVDILFSGLIDERISQKYMTPDISNR